MYYLRNFRKTIIFRSDKIVFSPSSQLQNQGTRERQGRSIQPISAMRQKLSRSIDRIPNKSSVNFSYNAVNLRDVSLSPTPRIGWEMRFRFSFSSLKYAHDKD